MTNAVTEQSLRSLEAEVSGGRPAFGTGVVAALLLEIRRLQAEMNDLVEKARADEREQCCRDVCWWCRNSRPLTPDGLAHLSDMRDRQPCDAFVIRHRAERENDRRRCEAGMEEMGFKRVNDNDKQDVD